MFFNSEFIFLLLSKSPSIYLNLFEIIWSNLYKIWIFILIFVLRNNTVKWLGLQDFDIAIVGKKDCFPFEWQCSINKMIGSKSNNHKKIKRFYTLNSDWNIINEQGLFCELGGHSTTTWTEFCHLLTPPPCVDSFYTLGVDKNRHFLTPSPPHLVHVVIECPLSSQNRPCSLMMFQSELSV